MDVFSYANWCEMNWRNNLANMSGYEPITTFFSDLSIAEFVSGAEGVKDTYKRIVKEWLRDYKFFTEFVICLNHKAWEMSARAEQGNDCRFKYDECVTLCRLYSDLYYDATDIFYKKYDSDEHEKEREYFFEVTD